MFSYLALVWFSICFLTIHSTTAQTSQCYGDLGCIHITPEWSHPVIRPVNLFPLAREIINTTFNLYTRKNKLYAQKFHAELDDEVLYFDPNKETKFIIHGFVDNPDTASWIKEMRLELLKYKDMNVVEVDWGNGSLPPYTQATANIRLVALEITRFINNLKEEYGLNPADVHIIGHSLGAHTAGYVGQNVSGLGRITGLDPAWPYFQGMPVKVRLDPSDASFVDVIHTDGTSLGYGMSDTCGHVDFYPNNGYNQPGCDPAQRATPLVLIKENMEQVARGAVACNHDRSIRLFIESINSRCPYFGHPCASYESFLKGECFASKGSNIAIMGLGAKRLGDSQGKKYYLLTGDSAPYCRYHYRVTLSLAKPSRAVQTVQGLIKMTLYGEKATRETDLTPSGPYKFVHGTSQTFLKTDTVDIGHIHKADVSWRKTTNILSPLSALASVLGGNDHLFIKKVKVDLTSTSLARGENLSESLCPVRAQYGDLTSKRSVTFVDQCQA